MYSLFTSQKVSLCSWALYYKDHNSGVDWLTYLYPFDGFMWLCLILTMTVCGIAHMFAERNGRLAKGDDTFKLYNFLWNAVHGSFCQGSPEEPSTISSSIIFLTMFTTGLVIWSSYSAALTSFLTVKLSSPPFTNLETMVEMTSYNIVTVHGSIENKFEVSQ